MVLGNRHGLNGAVIQPHISRGTEKPTWLLCMVLLQNNERSQSSWLDYFTIVCDFIIVLLFVCLFVCRFLSFFKYIFTFLTRIFSILDLPILESCGNVNSVMHSLFKI